MSQDKVYVQFPRAGLGNMLLTWSRAFVFSELNNLEMHTSSWATIRWGTVLRREKKKRFYFGYFKRAGLLKKIRFIIFLSTRKKRIEPRVEHRITGTNELFIFNKIFTDYDFFKEIRPYKSLVRKGIFDLLQPRLKNEYNLYKKPVIGIHIRRGDFNKGSIITPLTFFIDVVNGVRKDAGLKLPVTIFTDAEPSEIEEITRLENTTIAESKPDILDLLLLASSETIVLSIGSTFSYWAAFLSEGKIIKNKGEWHVPFRSSNDISSIDEIIWKAIPVATN